MAWRPFRRKLTDVSIYLFCLSSMMGRVPIGWVTPILRFKIKNKNKYFYTPPPPILFFVSSFLPILPWVPDQGQGGSGLHCHSALPTHTREGRRGDWSFQDFILSFRSLQNFILSIRSVRGYTPSLRSFHNKLFHSMVSTGFHPSLPPPWSLQGGTLSLRSFQGKDYPFSPA
jgi:hypothetical protein